MKLIIPILLAMTLSGCGTYFTFYGYGDGLMVTTTQQDGTEYTVTWPGGTRAMLNDREDVSYYAMLPETGGIRLWGDFPNLGPDRQGPNGLEEILLKDLNCSGSTLGLTFWSDNVGGYYNDATKLAWCNAEFGSDPHLTNGFDTVIYYCAEELEDGVCADPTDPVDVSLNWHFDKRFKRNLLKDL